MCMPWPFRNVCVAVLLFAAAPVRADVYAFTDERGVLHITDRPSDTRYELVLVSPAPVAPSTALAPAALQPLIDAAAARYRVEPALVHAVIQVESNFNPRAVSPKGARGLMQLMPATAQRLGVADAFDPRQNIEGGVRYLAGLLALFGNDLRLALAAYNAGENAVIQYGHRIPPFRETQDYVPKVLQQYLRLRAADARL
jgi:soluble lytic murein transglycosylase-like protein